MIAKIPEKRSDGQSSFKDLVEYMTNREDEKDSVDDELNTSDRRRNLDVLEAIGIHLGGAAKYLQAAGRAGPIDADAIRVNLRRARDAARANATTHELPNGYSGRENGERIDANSHKGSVARIEHNLRAAASYLRQAPRADRHFQDRARARRAYIARIARTVKQRDGQDGSGAQRAGLDIASLLSDLPQRLVTPGGVVCQHNCMALETASAEMEAVAAQNARVKDPVYHVVLSWAPGESPTDDQAFASALYALKSVGMEDHQYVFAIHRDTDNVHVHIAVNRVNPDTLRAIYPERDYYKLDYAMRELEIQNNWQRVAGIYSIFERNGKEVIDWTSADPNTKGKRPSKAADMERHEGVESLFTYVRGEPRRAIGALLKREEISWQSIHWQLAEYGLQLKPKGQGLAIYSLTDSDVTPVKASDLHENLSLSRLVKRLGDFAPPRTPAKLQTSRSYDKHRPLKRDPERREELRQKRADARRDLRSRYVAYKKAFITPTVDIREQLAALSSEARERRAQIKVSGSPAKVKKALYSIVAFETLRERERLKADAAQRRSELRADKSTRVLTFRSWVEEQAAQGDSAAISQVRGWAYADKRKAKNAETTIRSANINGFQGVGDFDPEAASAKEEGLHFKVFRDGSVLYQDKGGESLFKDLGSAIHMVSSDDLDDGHLALAIRRAAEKFKDGFQLCGSEEFRARAIELMAEYKIEGAIIHGEIDAARSKATPLKRGSRGKTLREE